MRAVFCLFVCVSFAACARGDGGKFKTPKDAARKKAAALAAETPNGKEPAGIAPVAVTDDVEVSIVKGAAVNGFDRPVAAVAAKDGSGRLFVVEQTGRIKVVKNGVVEATPWLDATKQLGSSDGEQGLLGLAFHPKFKDNGRFFVAYTDKKKRDAVAALRVTTPGSATSTPDPSSWDVLLSIDDPAPNHNGGHLLFGPDGQLWIGTGDGGGANDPWRHAQDPFSLLGKMLRLDVDTAGSKPTIWARGLRNPWRYDFDTATGDLWIADVGQNTWEEVDVVRTDPKTGLPVNAADIGDGVVDFGWSDMEGRVCFASSCSAVGRVVPAIVYSHDFAKGGGCSVTGGVVVGGAFFYADYCSGAVSRARKDGDVIKTRTVWQSGLHPSSFGVDEAGGLWLVDHGGQLVPLTVTTPAPTTTPPTTTTPPAAPLPNSPAPPTAAPVQKGG